MELPIFALHSTPFPAGRMALRVFEPRYLDMIGRCLRENSEFGICMIRAGRDTGAAAEIYDVGVTAAIVDWEQLKDGLLGVTVEGRNKFDVSATRIEKGQLTVAEVSLRPPEKTVSMPERYQPLADFLRRVLAQLAAPYDQLEPRYDDAGWVGSRLSEILPFKVSLKQRLLDFDDPNVRLEHIRLALQEKKFT